MSDLQRTIEADPYKVVVNLEKVFHPAKPDEVVGYMAIAIITRLDGNSVYKTFRMYRVEQGEVIDDRLKAFEDAESRAREAINNGFPD